MNAFVDLVLLLLLKLLGNVIYMYRNVEWLMFEIRQGLPEGLLCVSV